MPASRFARYALPVSAIVGTAAIGLFSYGVFADGLGITVRIGSLVAGVLLMFVAVAMIASRVVRPLAFVLGAPGARLGGTAGSLARQNAVGTRPERLHGRGGDRARPITFVAVIGQGFKSSFTGAVNELFVGDYSVSAGNNGELLTNKAAQAVAKAPGVEAVSEMRSGEAKVAGQGPRHGCGFEPDEGRRHRVVERLQQRPGPARPRRRLPRKRYAEDHSLKVGSRLTVKTPTASPFASTSGII